MLSVNNLADKSCHRFHLLGNYIWRVPKRQPFSVVAPALGNLLPLEVSLATTLSHFSSPARSDYDMRLGGGGKKGSQDTKEIFVMFPLNVANIILSCFYCLLNSFFLKKNVFLWFYIFNCCLLSRATLM